MHTHIIIFFDRDKRPLKISEATYEGLRKKLLTVITPFIEINGQMYSTKDIKRIEKIKEMKEPLFLPPPPVKPVTKTFLQDMRNKLAKKFGWKKNKTQAHEELQKILSTYKTNS